MIEVVYSGWRKTKQTNIAGSDNKSYDDLKELNINAIINPTDKNFSIFPGENAEVYFMNTGGTNILQKVDFPFDIEAGISENIVDPQIKILHLIGPARNETYRIEHFRKSFASCLDLAFKSNLDCIGFPTLGYSVYDIHTYVVGEIVISEAKRFINEGKIKRFVCITQSEYLFNLYQMLITLPPSIIPKFITFTDERIRKYLASQDSLAKAIQKLEKAKKKIEQYNLLLERQKSEISIQNEILQQQKQNITDSIKYASLIQNAELPPIRLLQENFPNFFVLYQPCQIVSGDFYWFKNVNDLIYIAAADCTGHGVPGALMSMLGVSLLNEIVSSKKQKMPNQILGELRAQVKKSLHQTGKKGEQQDGMDIAFCLLDKSNNQLHYAGAYNSLYLIRDGQLLEYKADRMPIGVHLYEKKEFTNRSIEICEGDNFYIFSDGYVDQFGGPNEEKFKSKRFRELLISIHQHPMKDQYNILIKEHEKWRGELPQTDDILIIGFRIEL